MDRSLFINLFARLLTVACPVVAFRFARRRSMARWQYLLLCAAAAALANLLWVVTMVLAGIVWFPSIADIVSGLERFALYNAAGGLLFAAVALWRRVTSTSRLALIALAMVAAVDVVHIIIDPIFGLAKNETRPVMLMMCFLLASLIYAWNPGAERELSVAKGEADI